MRGYSIGINNGIMCPNDCRKLEGFDLIPDDQGGNIYMVQGAMIPLSMVGAAYANTSDPTPPSENDTASAQNENHKNTRTQKGEK